MFAAMITVIMITTVEGDIRVFVCLVIKEHEVIWGLYALPGWRWLTWVLCPGSLERNA